jgi:hypothetical protein
MALSGSWAPHHDRLALEGESAPGTPSAASTSRATLPVMADDDQQAPAATQETKPAKGNPIMIPVLTREEIDGVLTRAAQHVKPKDDDVPPE